MQLIIVGLATPAVAVEMKSVQFNANEAESMVALWTTPSTQIFFENRAIYPDKGNDSPLTIKTPTNKP